MCTTMLYNQHRTILIIFHLILQAISVQLSTAPGTANNPCMTITVQLKKSEFNERHQLQETQHKEIRKQRKTASNQLSESTCSDAEGPPTVKPPITCSRPLNVMNEHEQIGTDMFVRAVHVLTAGSNISA